MQWPIVHKYILAKDLGAGEHGEEEVEEGEDKDEDEADVEQMFHSSQFQSRQQSLMQCRHWCINDKTDSA